MMVQTLVLTMMLANIATAAPHCQDIFNSTTAIKSQGFVGRMLKGYLDKRTEKRETAIREAILELPLNHPKLIKLEALSEYIKQNESNPENLKWALEQGFKFIFTYGTFIEREHKAKVKSFILENEKIGSVEELNLYLEKNFNDQALGDMLGKHTKDKYNWEQSIVTKLDLVKSIIESMPAKSNFEIHNQYESMQALSQIGIKLALIKSQAQNFAETSAYAGKNLGELLKSIEQNGARYSETPNSHDAFAYYYSNPLIGANFTTIPGILIPEWSKPVATYELNGKKFHVMRVIETINASSVGRASLYVTRHYYNRNYSQATTTEKIVLDTKTFADEKAELDLFIIRAEDLNRFVLYHAR